MLSKSQCYFQSFCSVIDSLTIFDILILGNVNGLVYDIERRDQNSDHNNMNSWCQRQKKKPNQKGANQSNERGK